MGEIVTEKPKKKAQNNEIVRQETSLNDEGPNILVRGKKSVRSSRTRSLMKSKDRKKTSKRDVSESSDKIVSNEQEIVTEKPKKKAKNNEIVRHERFRSPNRELSSSTISSGEEIDQGHDNTRTGRTQNIQYNTTRNVIGSG